MLKSLIVMRVQSQSWILIINEAVNIFCKEALKILVIIFLCKPCGTDLNKSRCDRMSCDENCTISLTQDRWWCNFDCILFTSIPICHELLYHFAQCTLLLSGEFYLKPKAVIFRYIFKISSLSVTPFHFFFFFFTYFDVTIIKDSIFSFMQPIFQFICVNIF